MISFGAPNIRDMEKQLYRPVENALMACFSKVEKRRTIHIESTDRGFSEAIKRSVPQGKEIVFSFFKDAKPDLTGYLSDGTSNELMVVEIKDAKIQLKDIYQAKRYKELLGARYGFVVSSYRIPEELKRLCSVAPAILNSFGDHHAFLVLAHFSDGIFHDWFPENYFETWSRHWQQTYR